MAKFIIIPADIAQNYEGQKVGENIFTTIKTLDERVVCAHSSLDYFFSLFTGRTIVPVELSNSDFPVTTVNILNKLW